MKLYADRPGRRTRQIIADLLALFAIAFFVWAGVSIHNLIAALGDLALRLREAGDGFSGTMTEIGETLGSVPFIGPGIAAPFDGASGAGDALARAGQTGQDTIAAIAVLAGILVAVGPIVLIAIIWLVPRLRGAVRAGELAAIVRAGAPLDLVALRALSHRPVREVVAVSADAAGQWRRGDADTIRALAELELRAAGVALPHPPR